MEVVNDLCMKRIMCRLLFFGCMSLFYVVVFVVIMGVVGVVILVY